MIALAPDLAQTQRYLDCLDDKGDFTFQTFCDKGNYPALNRVFHGTLNQHAAPLIKLNLEGAGIFVMVNKGDGTVHSGKRTCRTNTNVTRIRAVFVDLDGAPLEPILTAALQPQIIVESSRGKWHAYWLTTDTTLTEFRDVQQALASRFGGDPSVCDLARVMRLPGFFHQKADPFMTSLISDSADFAKTSTKSQREHPKGRS